MGGANAYFEDEKTDFDERVRILKKSELPVQIELFKIFISIGSWKEIYLALEHCLKETINLNASSLVGLIHNELIHNEVHWKDKKGLELMKSVETLTLTQATEEDIYELFLLGYGFKLPESIIIAKIPTLEKDECKQILANVNCPTDFKFKLLSEKLDDENIDWIYSLGIKYLSPEELKDLNTIVFEKLEEEKYFEFWKKFGGNIVPEKLLIKELQENSSNIKNSANDWLSRRIITEESVIEIILKILQSGKEITDKIIFNKIYSIIEYAAELNESVITEISNLQNTFYDLILWLMDKSDRLDLEVLKKKFIYFSPTDQVLIIKKLFMLKEKGLLDLKMQDLAEIVRVTHDIYSINEKFHPEVPLDLTTDLVIQALDAVHTSGQFIAEGQVLNIVLKNLAKKQKQKIKIADYFEKCTGRMTRKINLHDKNGDVKKVSFGDGKFYFSIDFEYSSTLVDAVKALPGRKYNPANKNWGVPSKYEAEVVAFAAAHRFYFDYSGNEYDNNPQLAVPKREDIPNGIIFCEGKLSKKVDRQQKLPFYWCCNQPCFQLCETTHELDNWKDYNFLDFCRILDIKMDTAFKDSYYQFMGLLNRFSRLLKRLYCTECDHILHSASDTNYGHYRVTRFKCKNETCTFEEEVYLHHCLNGKCNSIIDSRVSKKCSHGLIICEKCLTCCSHDMFSRRLKNLETTGGHVHQDLRTLVESGGGHKEKESYFCYKCSAKMENKGGDHYACPNGHLKIDLSEFKKKRY